MSAKNDKLLLLVYVWDCVHKFNIQIGFINKPYISLNTNKKNQIN